ncbi:hypothetical protein BTI679_31280 [Bacillus wiedmannii]|nr:hypothetical protein BTI679_31280 [Bacillus wiedmannii]
MKDSTSKDLDKFQVFLLGALFGTVVTTILTGVLALWN